MILKIMFVNIFCHSYIIVGAYTLYDFSPLQFVDTFLWQADFKMVLSGFYLWVFMYLFSTLPSSVSGICGLHLTSTTEWWDTISVIRLETILTSILKILSPLLTLMKQVTTLVRYSGKELKLLVQWPQRNGIMSEST